MDNFTEFFSNTGSFSGFEPASSGAVEKAKSFSLKLEQLIGPEAKKFISAEQDRAARLNAKAPVVPGVSNSLLFYGAIAVGIYAGFKLAKAIF